MTNSWTNSVYKLPSLEAKCYSIIIVTLGHEIISPEKNVNVNLPTARYYLSAPQDSQFKP